MKSLVAALAAALFVSGSWAELGAATSHLPAAAAAPKAKNMSTGSASYTVVQRQLDSGTSVSEFVDASGTVFAVSWSGPFLPDLKELLGVHFQTMASPGAGRRSGRSQLAVQDADAVIVSEGRMGAFEGRAWLRSRLPAGFDVRGMP